MEKNGGCRFRFSSRLLDSQAVWLYTAGQQKKNKKRKQRQLLRLKKEKKLRNLLKHQVLELRVKKEKEGLGMLLLQPLKPNLLLSKSSKLRNKNS